MNTSLSYSDCFGKYRCKWLITRCVTNTFAIFIYKGGSENNCTNSHKKNSFLWLLVLFSPPPGPCSFNTYMRITCHYGLADQSNNNHFKNTPIVHFSAFVKLATETSALLPLWRLRLSVYFHLGEYYWKDFSSPEMDVAIDSVSFLFSFFFFEGD